MDDAVICEATLLARTVPEETSTGDISICSAWWQPSLGGLIRVYPLVIRPPLKAWRRYRLELVKSAKDHRWRSFKLAERSQPILIKGHDARDDLRDDLKALASRTTLAKLQETRDSLGILRPIAIKGVLERDAPDVTHRFGRKTYGVRPRLQYTDADGSEHNAGLNEWGCFEWLRKRNPPEQLWANLRLNIPDRDQLLLVGNLRDHPTSFIVITVVGYASAQTSLLPPVVSEQRARIFDRDGYQCTYTDAVGQRCPDKESLTIDHVIPGSRGGDNDDNNLRTFCLKHNARKGDRLDSEWLRAEYAHTPN